MGYIGVYNPLILTFYQHFRPGISNSPTTIPPAFLACSSETLPPVSLRFGVSGFAAPRRCRFGVYHGMMGSAWAILGFRRLQHLRGHHSHHLFCLFHGLALFKLKKKVSWHDMNPYNFMFSSPAFNSDIYQN